MSTTISKYDEMVTEFLEKWEGTKLNLMELVMMLDASKVVLTATQPKPPTTQQVIEFAKIVAQQLYR